MKFFAISTVIWVLWCCSAFANERQQPEVSNLLSRARSAFEAGDLAGAEKDYEAALAEAERSGVAEDKARCLGGLAMIQLKKNNTEAGLMLYRKALEAVLSASQDSYFMELVITLFDLYQKQGAPDKGFLLLEQTAEQVRHSGATLKAYGLAVIRFHEYQQTGNTAQALKALDDMVDLCITCQALDYESCQLSLLNAEIYAVDIGNLAKGWEYFEKKVAFERNRGTAPALGQALESLAELYRSGYRHDEATRCLEEAVQVYRSIEDKDSVVRTLKKVGEVYRAMPNFQNAEKCFSEAAELQRTTNASPQELTDTLMALGACYSSRGAYDLALKTYHEARAGLRPELDSEQTVALLLLEAAVYRETGAVMQSLETCDKAVALCLATTIKPSTIASVLYALGEAYVATGAPGKSYLCHQAALHLRRFLMDSEGIAESLIACGLLYHAMELDVRAIACFDEAKAIDIPPVQQADLESSYGELRIELEDHEEAIQRLSFAIKTYEKLQSMRNAPGCLIELSRAYGFLNRIAEATEALTRAQSLAEKFGLASERIAVELAVARLHERRDELDLALTALTRAINLLGNDDNSLFVSKAQWIQAEIDLKLGRIKQALLVQEEVFARAKSRGNLMASLTSALELARLHTLLHHRRQAVEYCAEAQKLTDSATTTLYLDPTRRTIHALVDKIGLSGFSPDGPELTATILRHHDMLRLKVLETESLVGRMSGDQETAVAKGVTAMELRRTSEKVSGLVEAATSLAKLFHTRQNRDDLQRCSLMFTLALESSAILDDPVMRTSVLTSVVETFAFNPFDPTFQELLSLTKTESKKSMIGSMSGLASALILLAERKPSEALSPLTTLTQQDGLPTRTTILSSMLQGQAYDLMKQPAAATQCFAAAIKGQHELSGLRRLYNTDAFTMNDQCFTLMINNLMRRSQDCDNQDPALALFGNSMTAHAFWFSQMQKHHRVLDAALGLTVPDLLERLPTQLADRLRELGSSLHTIEEMWKTQGTRESSVEATARKRTLLTEYHELCNLVKDTHPAIYHAYWFDPLAAPDLGLSDNELLVDIIVSGTTGYIIGVTKGNQVKAVLLDERLPLINQPSTLMTTNLDPSEAMATSKKLYDLLDTQFLTKLSKNATIYLVSDPITDSLRLADWFTQSADEEPAAIKVEKHYRIVKVGSAFELPYPEEQ